MKPNWYGLSVDAALDTLNASHERGLSRAEVEARRPEAGWNELAFKKTPAWVRFLRQFKDSMVIILLVTAAITGLLTALGSHMLPDTLVILGVVLLNAVLGFVQEGKAEGALDALRSLMVPECLVMRDGELMRLPSRELVPGDVVILEGGDKIPADIRFIDTSSAYVDESSLTGESVPVQKSTQPIAGDNLVPGDQRNMGFSGTYLTQGTARGLVVETGANTVFGQIADMVKSADSGQTPLQRKMSEFVHTLIKAILAVGVFNFVYGLYLGYDMGYSFLGAVSLVVAAIPEMLPALVTAILAVSGTIMASRKALIRKLPAAETLGATSVICSDKTGTLTENRMTVTRVQVGTQTLEVTGVGYDVTGHYARDGERLDAEGHPALRALMEVGASATTPI
jgi:magnesium-transporting ATPase (P-type)